MLGRWMKARESGPRCNEVVTTFDGDAAMIDSNGIPVAEIMTAEQLERIEIPGKSTELVRGRLVILEPPGTYHGKLAGRLLVCVGAFVKSHRLGEVFGQDTGFKIASSPDTVRAPDL